MKRTTVAQLDWFRCMIFYNNLHRFTRLICVIGLFPKLDEINAELYTPSLITIQKALDNNIQETKKAKGLLSSTTNRVLNLGRQHIGVYIRKIHVQDFLKEKSLLLPLLVHSWVMFAQHVKGRTNVWPGGYVVSSSGSRSLPKRCQRCMKHNPGNQNESLKEPKGYYSLCPGTSDENKVPLLFEFLPYVVMKGNINNVDQGDSAWAKAKAFKDDESIKSGIQRRLVILEDNYESVKTSPPKKKKTHPIRVIQIP